MKLRIQPGKRDKIHIYIDEEYRLTVDDRFWFSERWHNLTEIDDAELAALTEAVGSRRAFNSAMDLLSRRDHGEQELFRKLRRKYTAQEAAAAVEKAKDAGFLDDARFAALYAQELSANKHFAPRRILQELRAKGIAREIAENAVQGLDKDDENRIIELLRGKYRSALSDEKGIRRATNGLLRMGYSYADVRAALQAINLETEEFDNA